VTPNNRIVLSCEVDKDTIRRTSAAYVSPEGREGFDNITDKETYRYDVNFRSTSNVAADEFTVDDPLENINNDQVRLEMLVTPVVWGDVDGKYNLWYKTNKTNDNQTYSDVKATEEGVTQRWPNKGFKLWAANLSTTERRKLEVSMLGLDSDEYITALRFEYGAVLVGFTSKNYSSVSLNGEHRDAQGDLTLPPDDLSKVEGYTPGSTGNTSIPISSFDEETKQSEGNFFTRLFAGLFGGNRNDSAEAATVVDTEVEPAAAFVTIAGDFEPIGPGDVVDWTPDPARADFATGALNATGLAPVSYLVSATQAMEEERIVTSAKSQIARGELWDNDIDAVVTLQINTFMPDFEEGSGLNRFSMFSDEVPLLGPNTLQSENILRGRGTAPRTFDDMKPLLWIVTAFVAAFCILLLLRVYNMRKRRMLLAQKRRRYAR